MKQSKMPMKKLIVDDETVYNIVALKMIESASKVIYLEEIQDNKIKFLISSNIFNGDLNTFQGLKFIRENDELTKVELLGLDIFLDIKKVTLLNITKKLFFIEEFEENCFRITFTKTFIKDLKSKETLIIE